MGERELTGYPSIDKPWLKYYSQEAISAPLPECTIYEMLWKNNKDHLDDVALNYYGHKITYGQMFHEIENAAKGFSALGVQKGEVVILCMVNMPEMVYALYALNRLGAIVNMVDPRTNVAGVHEYILESKSRLVMTVDLAYKAIEKAAEGTDVQKIIIASPADSLPLGAKMLYRLKSKAPKAGEAALSWREFLAGGVGASPNVVAYEKNTCCVMAHTGGTTGFPKTVMISNDNLNAVTHGYRYVNIPFQRQHKYFNDLPPFIIYGLALAIHTTLSYGLQVILYPKFDSKEFPKLFAKYKPHHFSALADHLKYLAADPLTQKMDLSFLISPGVGGDSLSTELEQRVNEFLKKNGCQFEVSKGYGMTELSATSVLAFRGSNAIGSVGTPLVNNNIKIVDVDNGQELKCDQTGEVWISGPSVMMGYYNKPRETSEIIVTDENGARWIRTGDLGHVSQDGLLFLEGRIRRIYLTAYNGQPAKIFPMPVEDALRKLDAVRDCSVVGRKRKGSDFYEAVAFIVKEKGSDEEVRHAAAGHCAAHVPEYMVPAQYLFLDELPHTPIGKVDFRALEKIAAEQAEMK